MLRSSSDFGNFVNSMVKCGNRAKAYKFYHYALCILKHKTKSDPIALFEKSFIKLKPAIRVVPFKRGARARLLPLGTFPRKQLCRVVKWILRSSREDSKKPYAFNIANVVFSSTLDKGPAIDKKLEYHKLGFNNKRTIKSLRVWRWFKKKRKKRKLWKRFRLFFTLR